MSSVHKDFKAPAAAVDTAAPETTVTDTMATVPVDGSDQPVEASAKLLPATEPKAATSNQDPVHREDPPLVTGDVVPTDDLRRNSGGRAGGRQIDQEKAKLHSSKLWDVMVTGSGLGKEGVSFRYLAVSTALAEEVYNKDEHKSVAEGYDKVAAILAVHSKKLLIEVGATGLSESTGKRKTTLVRRQPKDPDGGFVRKFIEGMLIRFTEGGSKFDEIMISEKAQFFKRDLMQLCEKKEELAALENRLSEEKQLAVTNKKRNIHKLINKDFDEADDDSDSDFDKDDELAGGSNDVAAGASKSPPKKKKRRTEIKPKPAAAAAKPAVAAADNESLPQLQRKTMAAQVNLVTEKIESEKIERSIRQADADARRELEAQAAVHKQNMEIREMGLKETAAATEEARSRREALMFDILTKGFGNVM
jgi:hypothetical protein